METMIVELMEAQGGAASLAELTRLPGVSRYTVDALVRARVLLRVRRGAFVLAGTHAKATSWEREELLTRAVGHSLAAGRDARHALSHTSALVTRGMPHFGADGLVHLARFDGGRGRHDGTIFVHRPVDPQWVDTVDGLHVVRPALAALQAAALHGPRGRGRLPRRGAAPGGDPRPAADRPAARTRTSTDRE